MAREQHEDTRTATCPNCHEPTETTSDVPLSMCPDCIQRTAAAAGY